MIASVDNNSVWVIYIMCVYRLVICAIHCLRNQRVFLLDEDLSVTGMNFTSLLRIWDCAFSPLPPPLLVQPLISESTQLFDYVNKNSWQVGGRSGIIASSVGLVEQQGTKPKNNMPPSRFGSNLVLKIILCIVE